MKNIKYQFPVRYNNIRILGSGALAGCSLVLWGIYWLNQSERFLLDGILILPMVLLPALLFLHDLYWRIDVSDREIKISRLFCKTKTYHVGQINKIIAYSSGAEHGEVMWLHFFDGCRVKVSHSYYNYMKLHNYVMKHYTIEWR